MAAYRQTASGKPREIECRQQIYPSHGLPGEQQRYGALQGTEARVVALTGAMQGMGFLSTRLKEKSELKARTILGTGIVGSIVFAIGCFTPALVLLFGLAGLSAWMGWWLDYFLLYPGLAIFLAITAYGLAMLKRRRTR